MLRYNSKVVITSGFYEGHTGRVDGEVNHRIAGGSKDTYVVVLDKTRDDEPPRKVRIHESEMQLAEGLQG